MAARGCPVWRPDVACTLFRDDPDDPTGSEPDPRGSGSNPQIAGRSWAHEDFRKEAPRDFVDAAGVLGDRGNTASVRYQHDHHYRGSAHVSARHWDHDLERRS